MEVIKNGKDRLFIAECNECGSILKYTLNDVVARDRSRPLVTRVIVCPVCNTRVEVYHLIEYKVINQ